MTPNSAFLIGLVISMGVMIAGAFLMIFKSGKRRRGLQIFAVAFFGFAACISLISTPKPSETTAEHDAAIPAQQAQDAAETEARRKKGFNCLSPLDGHQIALILAVKQQLRDPASFEPIETKVGPMDATGKHAITMSYRARNGFGGMNVATAVAIMTNEGCAIELLGIE